MSAVEGQDPDQGHRLPNPRIPTIGQIVPGEVIKLVPFGAFVRVEEAFRPWRTSPSWPNAMWKFPDQVPQVGATYMFEVIDIDPDQRRISLSLKRANEGTLGDTQFDPTCYGMDAPSQGPRHRDRRVAGRLRSATRSMGEGVSPGTRTLQATHRSNLQGRRDRPRSLALIRLELDGMSEQEELGLSPMLSTAAGRSGDATRACRSSWLAPSRAHCGTAARPAPLRTTRRVRAAVPSAPADTVRLSPRAAFS
jgi:S1 RNA binding domain